MRRPLPSHRSLAWFVPISSEAAALGRSIAFAWALGPDELGRAMMLALIVRLVEMASDVGIDRLIIQADDGNSMRLQSELHCATLIRGLVSAGFVLAMAPILARLFADGPDTFSYAVLAIVPLVRGLAHLDYRRAERHFVYAKMAAVEGGATLAMVLSLLPAVWAFTDHRAMCVVLIAHALSYAALSHSVANRRYGIRFHLPTIRRCWAFGAPLILNAGLLFLTFYADRLIIAYAFDWSSVALYGVALQLALLPSQIVGRAAASLVLPKLRVSLFSQGFDLIWKRILLTHASLALALTAAFVAVGPAVIGWVYGDAFRPGVWLTFALALAAGFRTLRTPFSQLAIATGRTGDPARANIIRAFALVPATAFATAGFPLAAIAAAAAMGEAGATLRASVLAKTSSIRGAMKEVLS
jgi:O-antigen/teichoic acid export membrane protein